MHEHPHGPTVGHDVVQRDKERVLVRTLVNQAGAKQRSPFQIEGKRCFLVRQAGHLPG